MAKLISPERPLQWASDHDDLTTQDDQAIRSDNGRDLEWKRAWSATAEPLRCPECHSIVYSRRHPLCGLCAHPLPFNYQFSPTESLRIEFLLQSERRRHKQWLAKTSNP